MLFLSLCRSRFQRNIKWFQCEQVWHVLFRRYWIFQASRNHTVLLIYCKFSFTNCFNEQWSVSLFVWVSSGQSRYLFELAVIRLSVCFKCQLSISFIVCAQWSACRRYRCCSSSILCKVINLFIYLQRNSMTFSFFMCFLFNQKIISGLGNLCPLYFLQDTGYLTRIITKIVSFF